MTRYWVAPDGIMGVAPFVGCPGTCDPTQRAHTWQTRQSLLCGSVEKLGIPANQVLMIGDDIEADVAAAQAAGLKGALVRTGNFRSTDLEGIVRSDFGWDSVADLPRWWNEQST